MHLPLLTPEISGVLSSWRRRYLFLSLLLVGVRVLPCTVPASGDRPDPVAFSPLPQPIVESVAEPVPQVPPFSLAAGFPPLSRVRNRGLGVAGAAQPLHGSWPRQRVPHFRQQGRRVGG